MKNIIKLMDVIATDEEKGSADKAEGEADKAEELIQKAPAEDLEDDDWDLSPVEELVISISWDLAVMAAERFSDMVEGFEMDRTHEIINRIRHNDCRTSFRMLQSMFLITGYGDTVMALDLLMACHEQVEEVYEWFIEDLFDTDFFKWFLSEMDTQKALEESRIAIRLN